MFSCIAVPDLKHDKEKIKLKHASSKFPVVLIIIFRSVFFFTDQCLFVMINSDLFRICMRETRFTACLPAEYKLDKLYK